MRPFRLCDWAFDRHVVNLAIVLSHLSLVLKIQFGASRDCVESSEGWEVVVLMRRLRLLC
jgi:hypothetical protein